MTHDQHVGMVFEVIMHQVDSYPFSFLTPKKTFGVLEFNLVNKVVNHSYLAVRMDEETNIVRLNLIGLDFVDILNLVEKTHLNLIWRSNKK